MRRSPLVGRQFAFLALTAAAFLTLALALALPYRAGADGPSPHNAPHGKGENPERGNSATDAGNNATRHSPQREGGPDEFGYVFADNRDPSGPTYSWVPGVTRVEDGDWVNTSNTGTDPADDGVVTATIPFSFTIYGTRYMTVHISTNGNVHFAVPNDNYPGRAGFPCLPDNDPFVPKPMAAPLWNDLVVPETGETGGGGVYTTVVGTIPNRTFVVEWRNVYEYSQPGHRATFAALLDENGSIRFQYQSLSGGLIDGSDAVIGIQNGSGSIGLPYACYESSIVAERAIRYRVQPAAILSPQRAERGGAPGATVVYTETLFNQTGITNSFSITTSGNTWTTTVQPQQTGLMGNGESRPVRVEVQIPPDEPLGASDTVTVEVSSDLPAPGFYTATAVLTTSISSFGVEFNPHSLEGAGDYGETATYTTRLYNRSGQSNRFLLDVDNSGWPASVTPNDTGNLAPDASRLVTVTVQVPAGASLGMSNTLTLEAVGQEPDPGAYFGATQITTYAGRWRRGGPMPEPRSRSAAVYFPPTGRVYLLGGEFNNGSTELPIREYDPVGDVWRQRANLPVGVSNVGAAVIGNAIYVPGGYSGPSGQVQATLQIYFPIEDRTEVAVNDPLPQPRLGAGVATHGGKLYVIGGAGTDLQPTNTVYEYDPARPVGSRWTSRAPMPTARFYLGAANVDGVIYAVGGYTPANPDLAIVEAYDPASNTWSARAPMSRPRGGLALVGVGSGQPGCGGYLYALGGGWNTPTDRAERYDPAANRWSPISPVGEARRSLAAAYAENAASLVAIGGWNGGYRGTAERILCAGGITLPSPTPTVPVTPSATPTRTASPTACPLQFTDVPPGSTFYPYVRCLACQGILSGYADGTFRPGNNVTRGQLAKIVSNAAGYAEPVTGQPYEDVPSANEFYVWIGRLTARGHMSGYPCGGQNEPCGPSNRPYFRPGADATRGQISKIVANAAGLSGTPVTQTYEDVPPTSTFYLWIERLTARGSIGGYPCGSSGEPCQPQNRPYFRPQNNATRGQTSKIVAITFYPACGVP